MFRVGEQIVHPLHGVGVVEDVTEQKTDGEIRRYYVFRALKDPLVVLIPESSYESIGVRPVMKRETAEKILREFSEPLESSRENWNRRYRNNMERLRSGNPEETAVVVRMLTLRDREKVLSAGERKMLSTAKNILFSELSLVTGMPERVLENRLRESLAQASDTQDVK